MKTIVKLVAVAMSLLVILTSCGGIKSVAKTPTENQKAKFENKLRENSRRMVRNLDSLSVRFQGITLKMISSDQPFDTLFAEEMKIVADSNEAILKEVFTNLDSLEAFTADLSNANYTPFLLYVEDATQERTKELLTGTFGVKPLTFNQVVTEIIQLAKLNFLLLRGETLSTTNMSYVSTGIVKYYTPKDTKIPAYKDIQNQFLKANGALPNQAFYPASTATQVRLKIASDAITAQLWVRMRASRSQKNR